MAMSTRIAAPGKSTRRWLAGGTAAALMTLSIPLLALTPASAAGTTIDGFQIDGDTALPAEDWNSLPSIGVLPDSGDKSFRVVSRTIDNTTSTGQDATVFGSNNKEAPPGGAQWPNWAASNNGNATGKSDFGLVATYSWVKKSTDDVYLAFAFDRGSNSGGTATASYFFELNQKRQAVNNPNPDRSVGDLRISIYDQGSSNFTAPLFQEWNGTTWVPLGDQDGEYAITANSAGAITDLPSWWTSWNAPNGSIAKEGFVEGVFNLSSYDGATLDCPSSGFSAFNARSVTGASDKNLVDYINRQEINIPSACGRMTFTKTSPDGEPLAGTEITITPDPTPGAEGGSLTVTTGADGTVTIEAVQPGTYTIEETKAPLGYILVPWTQTVTIDKFGSFSYTFVNPLGDVQWTKAYEGYSTQGSFPEGFTGQLFTVKRTAGVALSNTEFAGISGITATNCTTACTFTVRDNGALDADSDWGKIRVNDLPVGTYEITETAGGQPAGFGPDASTATAVVVDYLAEAPTDDQGHVINYLATATGGTPTNFTNPRLPVKLSVKKLGQPGDVLVEGAVFDLYKVVGTQDAIPGSGDDVFVQKVTTGANGIGTSGNLAWGSSYYFVEVSVPAPWNLPDDRITTAVALTAADATAQAGGQAPQVLTVEDPKSAIVTDAKDVANLPAASINDVATVSGIRNDAGGTVTFVAYGPFASASLSGVCTAENEVYRYTSPSIKGSVEDNTVTVTSGDFVAAKAGYYYWVASYSGDKATGTLPVSGLCGDATEISKVEPAKPGISTVADGDKTLPSATLFDVATVTGLNPGATGTVTFDLYGPGDTTCSAEPIYTTEEPLGTVSSANGVYFAKVTSTATTVNAPGIYRWIASYSGDADNEAVSGECNDANENWKVDKAPTKITTSATPEATLPNAQISDSATVTGLTSDASGTVTFKLYGPVLGANPQPLCTTQVGQDMTVAFTMQQVQGGSVTVSSPKVTVNTAGAYYWVASYSGDANNEPSAGACGDTGETSIVKPGQPTIVTVATETAKLAAGDGGAQISDTATIGNLTPSATGTVTFEVFGPFDSAEDVVCTSALSSETKNLTTPVNGSVTISSSAVTVEDVGYYAWKVTYSGDADNKSVTHECGLVDRTNRELSKVTPTTPELVTFADQSAVLAIAAGSTVDISDEATITGLSTNATGTVTFELYGPSDTPVCEDPIQTANAGDVKGLVDADGKVVIPSGPLSVSAPGTYWWIARYASGDANNPSLAGECGDANESTVVTQGEPGIAKVVESPAGTAITGAVAVGTVLHYTVTVSNTGTAPATDNVTDVLPEGLGSPTGITNGGSYDPATRTITWTKVTVEGGASLELEYDAVVLSSAAAEGKDTLINVASWFDLSATTTTKVKWITVTATPQCVVDTPKVDYAITTHNLDGIEWTADLQWIYASGPNAGQVVDPADMPTTINGVEQNLTDVQLSGALLFPGTQTVDGTVVEWPGWKNVGTVDAPIWQVDTGGLPVILRATVDQTADSAPLYPPTADAACNPPGVPLLDKSSPNEVSDTSNGNVLPGSTVTYTITLTNNGGQAVTDNLVDTLPDGVSDPRNFKRDGVTDEPDSIVDGVLTWLGVQVDAGQTVTFTFDVTVSADPEPGDLIQLENKATWKGLEDRTLHLVPGPGVVTAPTLDKDSNPAPGSQVAVGDVITYTIKVGNDGNKAVSDSLVDTLPAGVEVVGNFTRDDGGQAEPDTQTATQLVWDVVTVQPGQVITFTYDVKVLDAALDVDSLVNTAEWFQLTDSVEHTVKQPDLPITGSSTDPLLALGWAGVLLTLGAMLVLLGRSRREREI